MTDPKVTSDHLRRAAYLYVRQSTLHQVVENTESTARQYALRNRAVALGWKDEQIVVVDDDLGLSGASSKERKGFQHLVAEVGLGRVGMVMGLEVSRLARNNVDWHRLLEICALTETLILDEDGLYDPGHFNDRLLLGLKGTMSEAELHMLRARLEGGILNKARRGELRIRLPIGFVYDSTGKVVKDPDARIRDAVTCLFATFERTGSAFGVVRHFEKNGLLFPGRLVHGSRPGDVIWTPLTHHRVLDVLHNPRYAGAFAFGLTRTRKWTSGGVKRYWKVPQSEWKAFIPDAHERYISWEQHRRNKQQLASNAAARGADRRHGPARTGPALVQGIVVCGKCGGRMSLRYNKRCNKLTPMYVCQRNAIEHATKVCQLVPGAPVDEAIGRLLMEMVRTTHLDVALEVWDEIRQRREEVVRLHKRQLEHARHEAELAQRRYLLVDPVNRLVAEDLERRWNEALRAMAAIEEKCALVASEKVPEMTEEERARIRRLTEDFPAVWNDPRTTSQERKRMVRLLIEDVTLLKTDAIHVMVRFKGGATTELSVPTPPKGWQVNMTPTTVIDRIRELAQTMTDSEIAEEMNQQGIQSRTGRRFSSHIVYLLRRQYEIAGPFNYLREQGYLTPQEVMGRLDITRDTVKRWTKAGRLEAVRYNDRGQVLYMDMGDKFPIKYAIQRGRSMKLAMGNAADDMGSEQYGA